MNRCGICGRRFQTLTIVRRHESRIHGVRRKPTSRGRSCSKCSVKLTTKNWSTVERSRGRYKCRECHNAAANKKVRAYRSSLKRQVLASYGNSCACCGERDSRFLTVDHINGDGAEHRRRLKHGTASGRGIGAAFYAWLKRNGFPKDNFQLLCWNCNCAKRLNNNSCPHKEKQK